MPFWIHLLSGEPLTFAGLWERWTSAGGTPLFTFTILTTEAAPRIAHIHPRMPVILEPEERKIWLDPERETEDLERVLGPFRDPVLEAYPVSTLVNSPRNDEPACIEPV